MSALLKISDAASIGLHALVVMAIEPRKIYSATQLSTTLKVSRNHLIKVMQRLTRTGLLRATRGPSGGFILAMPPDQITLSQIMEALEGRMTAMGCLLKEPVCGGKCLLSEAFNAVNQQLLPFFMKTTIADLAARLSVAATNHTHDKTQERRRKD